MKITNILVVGIGGQGVMTATEILAQSAMRLGLDAKKTEVAGMAQRGGVVSSHLRFGEKVLSPQITPGQADILLGFEAAEGLRWQHMLKKDGIALMNTAKLSPPVVELGLYTYPSEPIVEMQKLGNQVVAFDASSIAREIGDIRLGNTVMLGAIADYLPFSADVLLENILKRFAQKGDVVLNQNRQAFEQGRKASKKS